MSEVLKQGVTHEKSHTEGHHNGHHNGHSFWTKWHKAESFISKYIFSMDHKVIAKQFLLTGMFWGIMGGLLSLVFRLQLAFPDTPMPFLEAILGKWAEGGVLDPNFYNSLITIHGTVLVFFVLTGGLSGTFANLLVPLQVGARDMASPFLNMLSYWTFFLASVVMFVSIFLPWGPAASGWTAYPPLSALKDLPNMGIGMDLWLVSIVLFIVSALFGGLNYVTTILNMRTKGMTMARLPLTVWGMFIASVLGLLSFPVLLAAGVLLLADRHLGTSFYLSEIFFNGQALPNYGGSPILYQHLFWFLGHPEVYIIIIPAMGLVSEVLAVNSRKPIFGYTAMVISMASIMFLSFLVWAHHMFVSGMNPFLGSVFMYMTLAIAIPSAIKVFNWLFTIWKGNLRLTPAMVFALGFVATFIIGGLGGIFLGNAVNDIMLHDTYFVVGHFHVVMGVSALLAMFAAIYHWFPKMFGRMMNRTLGYIHFLFTMIPALLVFVPMHHMGMAGVPRRYYSFQSFDFLAQWQDINVFITIAAIIGFSGQLIFFYNFFYSMFRGKKPSSNNPWKATTLEWTTEDMAPGHGNWKGPIPTVYRWAYEYSPPYLKDADYVPQHLPPEEVKKEPEKVPSEVA